MVALCVPLLIGVLMAVWVSTAIRRLLPGGELSYGAFRGPGLSNRKLVVELPYLAASGMIISWTSVAWIFWGRRGWPRAGLVMIAAAVFLIVSLFAEFVVIQGDGSLFI